MRRTIALLALATSAGFGCTSVGSAQVQTGSPSTTIEPVASTTTAATPHTLTDSPETTVVPILPDVGDLNALGPGSLLPLDGGPFSSRQMIGVEGADFPPGADIAVGQCRIGVLDGLDPLGNCAVGLAVQLQVGADGTFTTEIQLADGFPNGGGFVDCLLEQCIVAASEFPNLSVGAADVASGALALAFEPSAPPTLIVVDGDRELIDGEQLQITAEAWTGTLDLAQCSYGSRVRRIDALTCTNYQQFDGVHIETRVTMQRYLLAQDEVIDCAFASCFLLANSAFERPVETPLAFDANDPGPPLPSMEFFLDGRALVRTDDILAVEDPGPIDVRFAGIGLAQQYAIQACTPGGNFRTGEGCQQLGRSPGPGDEHQLRIDLDGTFSQPDLGNGEEPFECFEDSCSLILSSGWIEFDSVSLSFE